MKFAKGDLVTHKCSPGDMKAEFLNYKEGQPSCEDKKVFIRYTEGNRRGHKGEWLEKYCIPRWGFAEKVKYPDDFKPTQEIGSEIHEKLDKITLEQEEMQRQLRANVVMSSRVSSAMAMQSAYSQMCMKRLGDSNTDRDDYYDSMKHTTVDALSSMYLGSLTKPTKETTMKETITEVYTDGELTQTLIGDQDIETMTASDMLNAIGNVNNAIEKLNKHDMTSTYVSNRAKKLTEFIESVYTILDNKFTEE